MPDNQNPKIQITIDLKALAIAGVVLAVLGGGWLIYRHSEQERERESRESVERMEKDFERAKFNMKLNRIRGDSDDPPKSLPEYSSMEEMEEDRAAGYPSHSPKTKGQ